MECLAWESYIEKPILGKSLVVRFSPFIITSLKISQARVIILGTCVIGQDPVVPSRPEKIVRSHGVQKEKRLPCCCGIRRIINVDTKAHYQTVRTVTPPQLIP